MRMKRRGGSIQNDKLCNEWIVECLYASPESDHIFEAIGVCHYAFKIAPIVLWEELVLLSEYISIPVPPEQQDV
jgi:hypothetical protein